MPFIQTPFITSNDGHNFKPVAARALGFVAAGGPFILTEPDEHGFSGFILLEDGGQIELES